MAIHIDSDNWNLFACSLLIETWRKLGIVHYFVSPGYRNAPFIAALQRQPGLELASCIDERAAAYQALGCAKALRRASVLLCTSGTAGANYLPAAIESQTDQWPLILVTADRPFELVHAAAQQVMDQRQLFGRFVKKSFDFPAPGRGLQADAWISYARELAQSSMGAPAGPIHINLPFHAPLDPVASADRPSAEDVAAAIRSVEQLTSDHQPLAWRQLGRAQLLAIQNDIAASRRGLILIGRLQDKRERDAAAALQSRLGWPAFADVGSGLKGRCDFELPELGLGLMQQHLRDYAPDCVLHLGRRLVSRAFDDFMLVQRPRSYWVFSSEAGVQDPSHLPQRRQYAVSLESLEQSLSFRPHEELSEHRRLRSQAEGLHRRLAELRGPLFCFADVSRILLGASPRGHSLFLGNSTAIRAFDSWGYHRGLWPKVEANRGVSGIEGLLATTIGLVRGSQRGWTCVIGDIALLHDLNSLLALQDLPAPLIIVLVNNGGGRIFETLPLHAHGWVKDPLVSTPHALRFGGMAEMAGIAYRLCRTPEEFEEAYERASQGGQNRATLIECVQDPQADHAYQQAIKHMEAN